MTTTGRGVVRLVVPSPDGTRVLARPNGLAGWNLPTIPVDGPLEDWDDDATARAEAILGAPVGTVHALGSDAWVVTATGRISAAGTTWIAADEAGRLGGDEAIVRRWAAGVDQTRGDATGG